ncbi:uncharacterized protein VP01_4859g1 [Puccinia sorghi]|uniref:DUF4939 domain-containing protein n=1 Tax=Puccinia sorghi TaxID=27349 RepID=A0A0L6UMD3_9BASI|nr:uncharacterized protein VP01_4859g1 [Puccinia sorghi]
MEVITEERKPCIEAETTCQPTEAQSQATYLTTVPTQSKTPKVGIPHMFDGTQGMKAEVYASQFSLYITENVASVAEKKTRVIFALLYLTGQTSQWADPLMIKVCDDKPVLYHEFTQALAAMYYDTEK